MPRDKRDMSRINMYVERPTMKAIKLIANKTGVPYSDVIRHVLASYVRSYIEHDKSIASQLNGKSKP